MKYQVGDQVLVMTMEGDYERAIIKGYMMIQRGENGYFKPEAVYIIDEVAADTDQLYVDAQIKLYHEECIYKDKGELAQRGLPVEPSRKPGFQKPSPETLKP